jgi:hypothetical protein
VIGDITDGDRIFQSALAIFIENHLLGFQSDPGAQFADGEFEFVINQQILRAGIDDIPKGLISWSVRVSRR